MVCACPTPVACLAPPPPPQVDPRYPTLLYSNTPCPWFRIPKAPQLLGALTTLSLKHVHLSVRCSLPFPAWATGSVGLSRSQHRLGGTPCFAVPLCMPSSCVLRNVTGGGPGGGVHVLRPPPHAGARGVHLPAPGVAPQPDGRGAAQQAGVARPRAPREPHDDRRRPQAAATALHHRGHAFARPGASARRLPFATVHEHRA